MKSLATLTLAALAALTLASCSSCRSCDPDYLRDVADERLQYFQ